MSKCSLVNCTEKIVGGFQEIIDVGTFDHPNATIPGLRTHWCDTHESMLRPTILGKRGRWLTAEELQE